MASPYRTLRDRGASFDDALGRSGDGQADGAARQLLQIYNGGLMGSGPGIFYLGHPVTLDGPEIEGGTATMVVDSTTSVAVDVLGGTPSVGDFLTAYGVGGRWVAERSMATGNCCCIWPCASTPPPDTWTVVDPQLSLTTTLTRKSCANNCFDSTGSQYCLWTGTNTYDFPGNSVCPPFTGVVVTYNIGCFSTVLFGGFLDAFWVSCGHTGSNTNGAFCPGGGSPPFYWCPGNNLVYNPVAAFVNRVVYATYACVQYPSSTTPTQTINLPLATGSYGPFMLYGLDCTARGPLALSWTLTPSTSTQTCTFACTPCTLPETNLTLSWNGTNPGSTTLVFVPGLTPSWAFACVAQGGGTYYMSGTFTCAGVLTVKYSTAADCSTTAATCVKSTAASYTCSPVSIVYGAGGGTGCSAIETALGITAYTVTV